jgi:hypothetical protein
MATTGSRGIQVLERLAASTTIANGIADGIAWCYRNGTGDQTT